MTDRVRLAVVTVGATTVGIDVAAVAQALPMPEALAPLPRRAGALAGMLEVDGAPLPVVDLARWVDTGPSDSGTQRRIVVLRQDGRRIGLLADAVQGFADVAIDTIARLHRDDAPDEVFQCAVRVPDTGALLCVLEVGRLMVLASAWHGEAPAGAVAPPALAGSEDRTQCAVLRAGDVLLALPAVRLAAVEAHPPQSRIGSGATAFCTWRERHVPAIDAHAAVGDGAAALARPLLAVVEHNGCLLGIGIDGALDMRMLVPPAPDTPGGIVYDEAGEALVFVDVAALFLRYPETALSMRRDAGTARAGRAANPAALLVFDAGTTLATPAGIVEHVLPLAGEAPATMRWQDRAIRVADRRRDRSGGHVMIVRDGDALVACVVERIRSMVPPGGGEVYALGSTTFVNVEGEGSYRIADAKELTA